MIVHETAAFTPQAWETFYLLVGTTAGALVGLQFVVLTLISEAGLLRGSGETLFAFGSPNVVHFCASLLISVIYSAPWHGPGPPGIGLGAGGACGLIYSVVVLRRALRQRDYRPVLEDWVWHAALPLIAYAALTLAGIALTRGSAGAPFVIGGSALLLVLVGIHNAWDTVTYSMLQNTREARARSEASERPRAADRASAAAGEPGIPAPPPPAPPAPNP